MLPSRLEMEVEKPVVRILVAGDVAPEMLDWIAWGLEEESIPVSREKAAEDATTMALAKRAACESRLHVGIGVSGRLREAVLRHRDQPDERPLLKAAVGPTARDELFRLGNNAARLVKGNPFRFGDAKPASDRESAAGSGCSPDEVEQIVSGVVEALLKDFQEGKGR